MSLHGIHTIDTAFHRDHFDAAYLVVEEGRGAFIDCGTNHSVPHLLAALQRAGWHVERQRPVDIQYDGLHFPSAFRLDLLVDHRLIVEIKSVERLTSTHVKQLLTYLRLLKQPVGLLLNFSEATMKDGIRRVVNDYKPG